MVVILLAARRALAKARRSFVLWLRGVDPDVVGFKTFWAVKPVVLVAPVSRASPLRRSSVNHQSNSIMVGCAPWDFNHGSSFSTKHFGQT